MKQSIAILLHNVRSAHNVGAIFRTADAAGVAHVYLTGYTPAPLDRFGRLQKEIAKTALGAERFVSWSHHKSPIELIKKMSAGGGPSFGGKKEWWRVVGVEQDARARDYRKTRPKVRTLFVFGNEVRGLSKHVRDACDLLVEIPMRGAMVRQAHHPRHTGRGKESLNVSVTAGIILFHAIS